MYLAFGLLILVLILRGGFLGRLIWRLHTAAWWVIKIHLLVVYTTSKWFLQFLTAMVRP